MGESEQPRLALPRWALPAAGMVVLLGLAARVYALGSLPGVNGDEAWYGLAVQQFDGRALPATPSGNVPGLPHLTALVLLQWLFPPSIALLRVPTVLASLGAIWLAYCVTRRLAGPSAGIAAAMLMAALPINIAYARFGWDPSYSGFLVLASLWLALRDRPLWSAILAGASLFVHSTNVFAIPFLWCAAAWHMARTKGRRAAVRPAVEYGVLLAALPLLIAVLAQGTPASHRPDVGGNPFDAGQWYDFWTRLPGLFTGDTVFRYIVGEGLGPLAVPAAMLVAAMFASALLLAVRPGADPTGLARVVSVGWLGTMVAVFVLAGSIALQPQFERYAFVAVAPTVVTFAVLLRSSIGNRALLAVSSSLSLALLALLPGHYFAPLRQGAANAPHAFWTGQADPKAAIAPMVDRWLAHHPDGQAIAQNYWIALPVQYLARRPAIVQADRDGASPPLFAGGQLWIVYRGGPLNRALEARGDTRLVGESGGWPPQRRLRMWEVRASSVRGNR